MAYKPLLSLVNVQDACTMFWPPALGQDTIPPEWGKPNIRVTGYQLALAACLVYLEFVWKRDFLSQGSLNALLDARLS